MNVNIYFVILSLIEPRDLACQPCKSHFELNQTKSIEYKSWFGFMAYQPLLVI